MISARKPSNERDRLKALRAYELLDTDPEVAFDAVTSLAAIVFDTPIAVISLIDENRQWFKSQRGLDGVTATERCVAFCAHTILGNDILEVPDAGLDQRFADNPLVTGKPQIRFYAGMPLIDPNGMHLGTLCVIDQKSRKLTPQQKEQLRALGELVVGIIQQRIRASEIGAHPRSVGNDINLAQSSLKKRSELLNDFATSMVVLAAVLDTDPDMIAE
jgi:GAF domain-containing protein